MDAMRDSEVTPQWLERSAKGDSEGWRKLLARYHDRLWRMVALRLDQRLQGRVDASDVLQEAYLDAATGLADYLRDPT
jgi:RNA polymerase sigma-70 factor, ECF subfamily